MGENLVKLVGSEKPSLTEMVAAGVSVVSASVADAGGAVVLEKAPISDTSWYAVFSDTEGNQMGVYEGTSE